MVQEIKGLVSGISYEKAVPRFIVAGLFTLLFHIFFLLFTSKVATNSDSGKNIKYVSLLPINTTLLSERKLIRWMDLMNPTYAICPDRKHGFSLSIPKKQPDDISLEIKKHFLKVERGAFLPLSIPTLSETRKLIHLWPYKSSPIFVTVPKISKDFYPAIIPDDSELPIIHFTGEEREYIQATIVKVGKKFSDTTLLRVRFTKTRRGKKLDSEIMKEEEMIFPRVQILSSCGNSDLDNFAIKKICFSIFNPKETEDSVMMTVRWR